MIRTRLAGRMFVLAMVIGSIVVGMAALATASDTGAESTPRGTGDDAVTTWTAPGPTFANLTSPESVHAAVAENRLTRTDSVAVNDTVVFAFESDAVTEGVARRDAESDAAAFLALADASDRFSFRMQLTNPVSERGPAELDLSRTHEADGLRVVPDEQNGTLYLALRTDRLHVTRSHRSPVAAEAGDRYRVNLTVSIGNGSVTHGTQWRLVERELSFETRRGDRLVFGAERSCHSLSATTNVAPGTRLAIRLNGTDDAFPVTTTARVDADGTVATTVGPLDLASNASFEVTVPGIPDARTGGIVAHDAGPIGLTAVSVTDQRTVGRTVTVDSVTIDGGGFAVIYPAAVVEDLAGKASSGPCPGTEIDRELADEAMLGTSGYLDPGVHRDITVTLDDPIREHRTLAVVPYRDADGDGILDSSPKTESSELDAPVANQEFIVYDTATVAPESTPDRSTAESGSTETDTTRTNSTGEHTATATSADGPGFDATVAVLTLLTGVLLSVRLRSGPPDSP